VDLSSTPCTAHQCPEDFWEPYDEKAYDSSSSEQDYFPTDDDSLQMHTDRSAENSKNFGIIVDLSE